MGRYLRRFVIHLLMKKCTCADMNDAVCRPPSEDAHVGPVANDTHKSAVLSSPISSHGSLPSSRASVMELHATLMVRSLQNFVIVIVT